MTKHETFKVAIITRTKNRSQLLKRSVESVLAQTNKDYVHVILNDGGDRAGLEQVLADMPDDNRVVIHNDESVGLIKALNQGVRAVSSDYVCILDDDDTWAPERLEKVLGFFDENPQAVAAVVKMDIVLEEEVDGKQVTKDQYLHPDSGDGEINLYKQCLRNYVSNGIVTYRRSVYEELGGYDESLLTAEDWDFGVRLLLKYDVELIQSQQPLFFYHQRPAVTGSAGNSVHAGVRNQEVTINKLRNKYLRNDINTGRLGVGFIMNQMVFDLANTVRLEGHVNRSTDEVKRELDAVKSELAIIHKMVDDGELRRAYVALKRKLGTDQ